MGGLLSGLLGLVRRKKGLAVGGLVHAIIAIVLGCLSLGYHVLFIAFMMIF